MKQTRFQKYEEYVKELAEYHRRIESLRLRRIYRDIIDITIIDLPSWQRGSLRNLYSKLTEWNGDKE